MRVLCCLSALLASLRYSATLSSLAVCSILICSVSLRIFCCSWAMACLVRWGSGVISSPPWNELSAPHETDWPRPLTSSRSIWSDERGKKDRDSSTWRVREENKGFARKTKKGVRQGGKRMNCNIWVFGHFADMLKKGNFCIFVACRLERD